MTRHQPKVRTLGLIGCRLFEDEIVHILCHDEDVSRIFVVENEESEDIIRKLEGRGVKEKALLVKEDGLADLPHFKGLAVVLWLKPMALHHKPEKLNEEIRATISKLEPICGSVLLFYGLCGNAFKHIEKDSQVYCVPVNILKDSKGQIVDDCIGTILGGTDEYYELLKRSSGTFFLTPMWAANWRELFHKVQILPDPNDIEGARYIFKCVGYKKVYKMDTGLGDPERFDREIDEFAQLFNFEKGEVPCTLEVVERSYQLAKEALVKVSS
jgi:hypothetical protein